MLPGGVGGLADWSWTSGVPFSAGEDCGERSGDDSAMSPGANEWLLHWNERVSQSCGYDYRTRATYILKSVIF